MTNALKMRLPIILSAAICLAAVSDNAVAGEDCECRYAGQTYKVGQCACIDRSQGIELACCGMVLNNTSWSFTGEVCPVAASDPPINKISKSHQPQSNYAQIAER